MFRLLFSVYGAVVTLKKLNVIKQTEKEILKFEILLMKSSVHMPINNKRIDFAPSNKSIMANKLLSTNLERFGMIFLNDFFKNAVKNG